MHYHLTSVTYTFHHSSNKVKITNQGQMLHKLFASPIVCWWVYNVPYAVLLFSFCLYNKTVYKTVEDLAFITNMAAELTEPHSVLHNKSLS